MQYKNNSWLKNVFYGDRTRHKLKKKEPSERAIYTLDHVTVKFDNV